MYGNFYVVTEKQDANLKFGVSLGVAPPSDHEWINQSVYQAWIQIKDPDKSTETEIYWNNVVCSVFYDSKKSSKIYYKNSCGFKSLFPLPETGKSYTKVHGEDLNCSNPWF
ncbi:MAG: hypothetical protein ACKO96_31140 [Flammeovirgaceae bacterium]